MILQHSKILATCLLFGVLMLNINFYLIVSFILFLGDVIMRLLKTDEDLSLRGDTLSKAIEEDKAKGLVPFCVVGTLGTTNCCSFDNILEIGKVCKENDVWFHIDAAYAGSAFICPEYR